MQRSLVGSEMCIRDSAYSLRHLLHLDALGICLLYTSDAADE
ncbi:hypothetical protein JMUB7512_27920 [Staphylococcus aureus]